MIVLIDENVMVVSNSIDIREWLLCAAVYTTEIMGRLMDILISQSQ